MRHIQRALISVYDKTGIIEFAKGLSSLGVDVLATGTTHKLLKSNGISSREVSEFTGFPEILGGRVKTLHPKVAGGLLAIRDDADHMQQVEANGISLIDLVCVNLYPFVETTRKPGVSFEEVIENIDIGGPTMIRAAAKNFHDVAVLTSPDDYTRVLKELQTAGGILGRETLFELARKAFLMTARYDGQIAQHLSRQSAEHSAFPLNVFADFEKVQSLRYGENPHQRAAFYRWGGQAAHGLAGARQVQGPELSYNNLVDLDAAGALVHEFSAPACCIIKHTNPCGTAIGSNLAEAYRKAYEADPLSAFGSVIGVNRTVDSETASAMAKLKIDAIAAPDFDSGALEILAKKKGLKLVSIAGEESREGWAPYIFKTVSGGILLQDADRESARESRVVTRRKPTDAELVDLDFAWRVVKHVKSNAIVLTCNGRTAGVGAGQMSRVDSVKISAEKSGPSSKGSVMASDAFFPFRDGIDAAAAAGVTAVIQPGGSVKDPEVIEAADAHGMAMIFTGLRHFRH